MNTSTVLLIGVLLLVLGAGIGGVFVLRAKGRSPEEVEARAELKFVRGQLDTLERAHADQVKAATKELKGAQRSYDQAIKHATKQVAELSDPKGRQIASYRGVTIYERWITAPHGQGPILGTNASVDAQVSKRITATRLVAIGVFALAAQKKTGAVYLSIDNDSFASVIECPAEDNTRARQFAVKIMNASRQAVAIEQSRPRDLKIAQDKLERLKLNTSGIETARGRLHDVESDELYLAERAARLAVVHRVQQRLATLTSKPRVPVLGHEADADGNA